MFCQTCGAKVEPDTDVCYCGVCPRTGHNFCKACGQVSYADEAECIACGKNSSVRGALRKSHRWLAESPESNRDGPH